MCTVSTVKVLSHTSRALFAQTMGTTADGFKSAGKHIARNALQVTSWMPVKPRYPWISMEHHWLKLKTRFVIKKLSLAIIYAQPFSVLTARARTFEGLTYARMTLRMDGLILFNQFPPYLLSYFHFCCYFELFFNTISFNIIPISF